MTQDQNEENKAIQDDEPDQFETPARTDGKESEEDTQAESAEKD
ncbi:MULTISPECIES: hypothetical protein [Paenibacillus]|nr:hypothetical protein [Paenibacillus pabuli]